MKTCTKCGKNKSLSEYGLGGKRAACKKCLSSQNAERLKERREIEPGFAERMNDKSAEWRKKNPLARAQYYQNNTEREKENQKAWQRQNRPWTTSEKKEYLKKWRSENKDLKNSYERNRQHRKRANGGSVSHKDWLELCAYYGNVCLRCGKAGVTMDHVVPISKGGSHSIENLQPLCGSCNSSKGTKDTDYRS